MKPVIVWAVGDGGTGWDSSRKVADLIARDQPDKFIYLGDVYESGTEEEFKRNYDSVFGRLKPITAPIPGNHDYMSGLSGWKHYWAGHPTYYSFKLNNWHVLCLDSETSFEWGSPQHIWLLENKTNSPTILCFHRSRYSAGGHGDQPDTEVLCEPFRGLPTILLTGHNHNMQRFKPVKGLTQFVSGACGHQNHPLDRSRTDLAFANDRDFGALRLELYEHSLKHQFISIDGKILDEGRITMLGGL